MGRTRAQRQQGVNLRGASLHTNSTSTASEGGALSDVEEPSSFQESYTRAETGPFYGQTTGAANGSSGSPVSPTMSSYSESSVTTTDARPHIKYVRAPPSSLTSVGSGSSANQAAFLTMTSPGVFGILSQVLAPGTSMAGVRVIAAAEGSASSLQSMVTVYPTSTSASKS